MIKIPTKATLKRYGLSLEAWQSMADAQGGVCFVCGQCPKSGILHVDHEHVKNWRKRPPEERVRYVRGLLCMRCNTTYVGRSITVERARKVVEYLENYAKQR